MILPLPTTHPPAIRNYGPEKALTLALSLAQAERAIETFSAGQLDAIVDTEGRTYLLRSAQTHLRESERRLQIVIESMADGLTVADRSGVIFSQNRAVTKLLGFAPDALLGTKIFEKIHEEDLLRFSSAYFNVIEDFRPEALVEFRHRTAEGGYRLIEAMVSRLRDATSSFVVLVYRDKGESAS